MIPDHLAAGEMPFVASVCHRTVAIPGPADRAADPDSLGGGRVAEQIAQALEPLTQPSAPVPAAGSARP
jgi:hypothetical protein